MIEPLGPGHVRLLYQLYSYRAPNAGGTFSQGLAQDVLPPSPNFGQNGEGASISWALCVLRRQKGGSISWALWIQEGGSISWAMCVLTWREQVAKLM